MKKISLLLLLIASSISAFSQVVKLENKYYTSYFDTTLNYPVKTEWVVTSETAACDETRKNKRSKHFFIDGRVKSDFKRNYRGSGYDRGHMMPSSDNACVSRSAVDSSFLFTNISPQHPRLNQKDWRLLEEETRRLASLYGRVEVETINIGEIEVLTYENTRVSVPDSLYKILKVYDGIDSNHLIMSMMYGFKNDKHQDNSFTDNLIVIKIYE